MGFMSRHKYNPAPPGRVILTTISPTEGKLLNDVSASNFYLREVASESRELPGSYLAGSTGYPAGFYAEELLFLLAGCH